MYNSPSPQHMDLSESTPSSSNLNAWIFWINSLIYQLIETVGYKEVKEHMQEFKAAFHMVSLN